MNKKIIVAIIVILVLIISVSLVVLTQTKKNSNQESLNSEFYQTSTSSNTETNSEVNTLEETKETTDISNACESACGYYLLCLSSKQSNINSEASLNNQYNSCLKECAKWSLQKIECVINSSNCEDISTKCGL